MDAETGNTIGTSSALYKSNIESRKLNQLYLAPTATGGEEIEFGDVADLDT